MGEEHIALLITDIMSLGVLPAMLFYLWYKTDRELQRLRQVYIETLREWAGLHPEVVGRNG